MRNFRDAKIMAKALRQGLSEQQINLSHSACLELIAKQFGFHDWNTLAARISPEPAGILELPQGWTRSGSKSDHYEMGVNPAHPGSEAIIRCKFLADDPTYTKLEDGFGTMMQSILAEDYRGKALRLTVELKADDVRGAGTIWMRIDDASGNILRFDNMEDRDIDGPVRGDTGWIEREIVLDVPDDAESIHYGFYLRGAGTLFARPFKLEEAKPDASVSVKRYRHYLDRPTNLGFSDPA